MTSASRFSASADVARQSHASRALFPISNATRRSAWAAPAERPTSNRKNRSPRNIVQCPRFWPTPYWVPALARRNRYQLEMTRQLSQTQARQPPNRLEALTPASDDSAFSSLTPPTFTHGSTSRRWFAPHFGRDTSAGGTRP